MGWAFGDGKHPRTFKPRKIGYGVEANCDQPGCKARIDRGLGYLCGGLEGADGNGCGGYFCGEHLTGVGRKDRVGPCEDSGYRCPACLKLDASPRARKQRPAPPR